VSIRIGTSGWSYVHWDHVSTRPARRHGTGWGITCGVRRADPPQTLPAAPHTVRCLSWTRMVTAMWNRMPHRTAAKTQGTLKIGSRLATAAK
jgi:hypothetical protein